VFFFFPFYKLNIFYKMELHAKAQKKVRM